MTQDRRTQAEQLVAALTLDLPSIAVAFSDAVPDGIPEVDGSAPAGCVFRQEAARRMFATSAGHHALCSIGIHTMNLSRAMPAGPWRCFTSAAGRMSKRACARRYRIPFGGSRPR